MSATPAAVTRDLMKQHLIDTWQAYHKMSSTKQLVNAESDYVEAWGKRTPLWTSAKLKPALFRAKTLHKWLISEPPTVYQGKRVVSRHFHHSYLKANKVSKSEGTRKVKYAYHFWKYADDVDPKLSKLVHACRSYSLPKLAHSVLIDKNVIYKVCIISLPCALVSIDWVMPAFGLLHLLTC